MTTQSSEMRTLRRLAQSSDSLGHPSVVLACAVCDSELGRQVRAGVFNSGFAPTTLAVLAPFPFFLLAIVLVRFALPKLMHPRAKPQLAVRGKELHEN